MTAQAQSSPQFSKPLLSAFALAAFALSASTMTGCATTAAAPAAETQSSSTQDAQFEKDRKAILAMAGTYHVTFDFTETVAFDIDYALAPQKISSGNEVVRVIADEGDYISLQHILVVGGEDKFPVKHWRQDWRYEPSSVLVFTGANSWERRDLSPSEAKGKWSQTVYQVDDAPRYGALGTWSHEDGYSSWTPPAEWRPLPRRDATTRDDYQAVEAINRHTITPDGWVHEQNNTKLILTGERPQALAREIGVNTYMNSDDFDIAVADDYWAATKDFWAEVRAEWDRIEATYREFGLSVQGEPEEVYMKILDLAEAVEDGEKTASVAAQEARAVIADYLVTDPEPLSERLAGTD
ncbi:DUF6607 family protein [Hyphococcus luteus]|uniref:Secreted protein n=1 Tax=Hyphococcus luteus TaxID=2058213 RepID=A0A2S7K074_9PROT|nr:DUF6607 family protein [Marinicaulis flavus]PQA85909.1 hypothetical protein CW354_19840 [Marinicaulis flavus]